MVTEQRLIDAHALLNYVKTTPISSRTRVTIMYLLDTAPTVDAAPVVHGWWISVDGEGKPCDEWDCSICERRLTFAEEMEAADVCELNHYCPNCGAKMDGGAPDA